MAWTRTRSNGMSVTDAREEILPAHCHAVDLAGDYHDLAVAVQGLGFLESGITDPLNHFSNTLLEFSRLLKHNVRGF